MGDVIRPIRLDNILADFSRRLSNVETGGRPVVGLSSQASASFTLAAGAQAGAIAATLNWVASDVQTNPGGVPYLALYIDNDNDANYLWPSGGSLTADMEDTRMMFFLDESDLTANNNRCRCRVFVYNGGSSSHDYFLKVKWTYIKGGSSSS